MSGSNRPYNPPHTPSPSESSRAPNVIRTSVRGRSFIERHEEMRGVSNRLHWPGGASGVTLGPGYDMRDRSQAEVEKKLRAIKIPPIWRPRWRRVPACVAKRPGGSPGITKISSV